MTQGRTSLLVLLALAIVAGLGVGAWFLLGGQDGEPNGGTAAGSGDEGVTPRAADGEEPTGLDAGARLEGPSAREPGRKTFADDPDPEDAVWIEGRVIAPAGAPRDETLAVVALGYLVEPELKERPDVAWRAVVAELPEEVGRTRRVVEDDGSFRVPVDAAFEQVFLFVDGRYAFLPEPFEIALAEHSASVTLAPSLGAWLSGTITIPLAPDEVAGLEGADIGLGIIEDDDQDSGFAFRFGGNPDRYASIGAAGRFSFRGLDPEALYDLAFRHDDYLPAMKSRLTLPGGTHEVADLVVDLGGRVAGRVVDEDNEPIEGATVRQVRDGFGGFLGGGSGRSTTDADGHYLVKALRPGKVSVRATHDGYVDSEPRKAEVVEGETVTDVEIVLSSGQTIAGRVEWPGGEPAVEARVFVERASSDEGFNWTRSARSAVTDDDGRFSIEGLDQEPYSLRATLSREPTDPKAAEERRAALKKQIDEAGPFGEMLAERLLDKADLTAGPKWTATAKEVATGTTDVLLTLEPPLSIEGFVRDESGAPITTFEVKARPARNATQFLPGVENVSETFEDPAGAFVLEGLQPGEWTFTAEASGYAATEEGVSLKLPADAKNIDLVLSRASMITGIVYDPTGQPVADARVQTGSSGGFRGTGRVERKKRRSADTDEEGRFELKDVPAESTVISATADGWAASDTLPIEPAPGGEMTEIVLHLKLGGTLTGEVYGSDGEWGACRVRYNSMSVLSTGAVTAEADGTFRIEHLTPGLYQVMVEPDPEAIVEMMSGGDQPDMSKVFEQLKMASAEVEEGQTTHVVLGQPPTDPVKVFGRLTEAGEPISGRMVIALAEGNDVMSSMRMDQTDEDGRFELELKAPGPVVFSVQLDGGASPQFFEDVPEVESWEVELALSTAIVSGTVYDPDGEPLSRIGVRITSEEGHTLTVIGLSNRTTTDSEGRYSFKNVEPGTYTVRAGGTSPFGGGDGSYGTELVGSVRLAEGEHLRDVDVHLSHPGRIEGHVRSAAGEPAIGAAVFVRDASGRLLSPFSGCVTNASGKFSYEGISPGAVTVSARFGDQAAPESSGVEIRAGEAARVDLQLEGGTMLIVSVEGEGGQPQRVQVRVMDKDGREYSGMAAPKQLEQSLARGFSSHEHTVGPLPAGRYKVIATTPDGKQHKKPVTLRGQAERKLRIRVD